MDEHVIREIAAAVRRGKLSRRRFTRLMVAAGLTAPMAASLLTATGVGHAQPKASSAAPTR